MALVGQLGHHAVQRAQLLFGDLAALEEMAEVAHHPRTLLGVAQEPGAIQLADEMGEALLTRLRVRLRQQAAICVRRCKVAPM